MVKQTIQIFGRIKPAKNATVVSGQLRRRVNTSQCMAGCLFKLADTHLCRHHTTRVAFALTLSFMTFFCLHNRHVAAGEIGDVN